VALPASLSLTIDRSARAWQQVYETLRKAIVSAQLEPGLSVSEHELAVRLGVSRTPVREALIRLSEEGLVGIFPQTGTVISPIRFPKVYQSLVIRSALECRSIRYAIALMTPERVDALRAIIADQRRHVKHGNDDEFLLTDDAFHRTMIEISGNLEVWKVIESTKSHHDRVRHLATHLQVHNMQRIEEHEAIIDALERRDAAEAERLLEVHLNPDRLDELWTSLSENYGDYFERA
jgi:GntR family transcriptional regulator, rspAB operon transcriptional repressor